MSRTVDASTPHVADGRFPVPDDFDAPLPPDLWGDLLPDAPGLIERI